MTTLIVHPAGPPGGTGSALLGGDVLIGGVVAAPVDITLKSCLYDPSIEHVAGYQPIIEKGGTP